ncbi:MAG: PTS sugar transporter subunit IIB [Gemmatimonadales bacterium]|jgi:PTS system mannose-specific IIB component/fructoselysine and glucoselysine-specific PTS system IIB component|nr:PTS sugar transporter subunit IIB [Gemmatimonadales bacterium]
MTLALLRVDDRLVHGQVVIGWGRPLAVRFIVLVDDGVRLSDWEQDLYKMAVPDGVEIVFASTAEAIRRLPEWAADPRPGILLTGDLATMATLHDADPALAHRINLGGIHHRPDRAERLRYLYLDDRETALLRQMALAGAIITAQDLPTSPAVALAELL